MQTDIVPKTALIDTHAHLHAIELPEQVIEKAVAAGINRIVAVGMEWKKPVIVHSRYSHEKTFSMVSEAGIEKAVFHWYSGPLNILERIIDNGYFVSATPALEYSSYHQAAITKAPLERILIETDAPVEYQGKISEPMHLTDTLRALSRLKEQPAEVLARITTENAERFFGI